MALTEAVAIEPGSRPSSCTASVDISETTRCGPHCISTWDITVSEQTSVTSPTQRLRAELTTAVGSSG